MNDNYLIWTYRPEPYAAILGKMTGLERKFRLTDGAPLADGFPSDVQLHFHPEFPNDITLVDNMRNTDSIAVVSPKLKLAVEAQNLAGVEFLPVSLIDHKGRTASSEYFIVHPIEPIDCVDREDSVFEESLLSPGEFEFFDKLVLNEELIPSERGLFRLKGFADLIIAHRDVAAALEEQGFTGLAWLNVSEYPEV
jgi:hypothetical protein